jgi:hypothetical protein
MMFRGGRADGANIEIAKIGGRFPPVQYISHMLSMGEMDRLRIDDLTAWKIPEDVYYLRGNEYVYDRTVHYKPDDAVPQTTKEGNSK